MQFCLHHFSSPQKPNWIAPIIPTAADLIFMIANSEAEYMQATHEHMTMSLSQFRARTGELESFPSEIYRCGRSRACY